MNPLKPLASSFLALICIAGPLRFSMAYAPEKEVKALGDAAQAVFIAVDAILR